MPTERPSFPNKPEGGAHRGETRCQSSPEAIKRIHETPLGDHPPVLAPDSAQVCAFSAQEILKDGGWTETVLRGRVEVERMLGRYRIL